MHAHPLLLLDLASSLRDSLNALFTNLFTMQTAIAALALTFVFAVLGWLIAFLLLRPKDVCSMVCSVHFLLVIASIILGIIGAFGLIDHYKGSLITAAGVALLVLTLPIFILAESFNYIVLSNQHARRHRDLRTPADKRTRRLVVFFTPLVIGLILVGIGLAVGTLGAITEVTILLLVLWVLALGAELLFLGSAHQRRRKLAAMPGGSQLDQEQLAALWASGISSYRIGRGRTAAAYWEEFTERVTVTEELLLEEEGELELVAVEEQETVAYTAGGAAVAAGPAIHRQHRLHRRAPAHRFRRRWGGSLVLLVITLLAVAVCVMTGVTALTTLGIALAFLMPAIFLVVHRMRRDHDVRFTTETVEKINATQAALVVAGEREASATASSAAAPPRPASAPPGLHPTRPTPVVPPAPEPVILPKEEPEPPTLPSAEQAAQASQQAVAAGQAHENPDVADATVILPGRPAGPAHENPDIADDTLLIAHTPATPEAEEITVAQLEAHFQDVPYPATKAVLLEHARKRNLPRTVITWLEITSETVVFTTVTEVVRRYTLYRTTGKVEEAEQTVAAAAAPARKRKPSGRIGIIDFQRYLHGVDYPATKAHLLEQARKNNAPPNMIARLEQLEDNYRFTNVSDVMLGYAYHRYLHGLHYPATKAHLLEHARKHHAPQKLLDRLEALSDSATFASLEEVFHHSRTSHAPEAEVEIDEEEE